MPPLSDRSWRYYTKALATIGERLPIDSLETMLTLFDETSQPAERVGVFGGTFDPLHIGHLIIASELQYSLQLTRVLFVPAGRPPHKADQEIGDDTHRLTMLRLAIEDVPRFEISTVDIDRRGPSYTADTLALIQDQLGPVSLVFLMGEDSLRDLPAWHEPDLIVQQAELGVATRPGVDVDHAAVFAAVPAAAGRVHLVEVPEIGVSSRDIRRRVAIGQPIRFMTPLLVEQYIAKHKLYRT